LWHESNKERVMRDLVIVGGGAAGLAAAAYALRNQLDTLLLSDGSGKAGTRQQLAGQNTAPYLESATLVQAYQHHIVTADAACYDRALSVTQANGAFAVETQQHGSIVCRALLIATGATPRPLPVPGAHSFVQHGVGYSAITHAPLCAGKVVAVVGATPRAIHGALALCRVAAQVYLLVPDARALDAEQAQLLQRVPNLTLLRDHRVTAIEGANNVERITVVDPDGHSIWIRVAAVFADLGLLPNSAAVRDLVETDSQGFICVDSRNATNIPGVFAAGDVTTAACEHSLIAVGAGVRAAISAYEYLLMAALNPAASTAA
jgi:thioredoxin reductase (NADPH)